MTDIDIKRQLSNLTLESHTSPWSAQFVRELSKEALETILGYEIRINRLSIELAAAQTTYRGGRVDVASRCLEGLLASNKENLQSGSYSGGYREQLAETAVDMADRLLRKLEVTDERK